MGRSKKNIDKFEANSNIITNDSDDDQYEDNYYATRDILGYYPPECPRCGTPMKFNFATRIFKCFSCRYTADEEGGEELAFADDDEYNDIYKRGQTSIPDCCISCGGPWPKCMSSCEMFDDE